MRRDANGVPIVNANELEQLAERFLEYTAPGVLRAQSFTPLAEIMAKLQTDDHVHFSFDEDLGSSSEGHKYLGCYDLTERRIYIDRCLADTDPRFPFTVAHELGHFYLHSRVRLTAVGFGDASQIRDSSRDIVVHRVDSTKPRTLLEWQANRFAAGILIPRATIFHSVLDMQRGLGIRRNLGTIWVDPHGPSQREFHEIVTRLSYHYRTSKAVMRYRLLELGIAQEKIRGGSPSRLKDVVGRALAEIFS